MRHDNTLENEKSRRSSFQIELKHNNRIFVDETLLDADPWEVRVVQRLLRDDLKAPLPCQRCLGLVVVQFP